MIYYEGDIVSDAYMNWIYDLSGDHSYKITRVTPNYYEAVNVNTNMPRAFLRKHSHETLILVKRGLKEKLSKL